MMLLVLGLQEKREPIDEEQQLLVWPATIAPDDPACVASRAFRSGARDFCSHSDNSRHFCFVRTLHGCGVWRTIAMAPKFHGGASWHSPFIYPLHIVVIIGRQLLKPATDNRASIRVYT